VEPLGPGDAVVELVAWDVVFGALLACGDGVPVRIGSGARAAGLAVAAGFAAELPRVPLFSGESVASRPADDVVAAVLELVTELAAEPLTPPEISPFEGCPELAATDELGDASTPVSPAVEFSVVVTEFAAFAGSPPLPAALFSTNHTKPTNAITATAITRDRRSQYTLGSRGPTGCITN
jgi:hypothetical protein